MKTNSFDQITVYSQTQRIVLLIDLNPLIHLQDPTPYITSLLCSTKNLLSFPPLSSSLFTFKLFFSSLSPLLSSSKLQQPSRSLSFNQPSFTLLSLQKTLNTLPQFHQTSSNDKGFFPHALNLAASMRQILYDYPWDPVIRCDPLTGNIENHHSLIKSNLVVLLSPICRSIKGFSKFLNVELADQCLNNVDMFSEKFCGVFRNVKDAFDCRDIHFTWIDVRYEVGTDGSKDDSEYQIICRLFEGGTKRFGWGFCSTDSIILGSALVPFGLIYPKIGMSLNSFDAHKCSMKLRAQLSLQISDVSGKPLEFRCCDLELLNLESLPNKYPCLLIVQDEVVPKTTSSDKKTFWEKFGDRSTVIIVKAVMRYEEVVKCQGHFTDSILLRELSKGSGKEHNMVPNEFFADKVLEMLAMEFGNVWKKNSLPIWQILLSFLYREGYCAMVSVMSGSEDLHTGILRPFTISSGLLSLLLDESEVIHDFSGINAVKCFKRMDNDKDAHVKSNLKDLDMLRSLTWSTFYKAAIEHTELDLYEVYIATESNDRKKKKFLKCWMKQIKKCEGFFPPKSNTNENIVKEFSDRVDEPNHDSETPFSVSTLAGENSSTDASRVQDEGALGFRSETSEEFFDNLPRKIQQGLGSEVDLGSFAYRLVSSSMYWLNHKVDREATSDAGTPVKKYDNDHGTLVASELAELLLREPKDISIGHKTDNASSQAVSTGSAGLVSENIIKESELQILFRMEILQSEIGGKIAETMKQKFVKQICFLLENIQCRMEGGFFGDWNLDIYVAKIIKSRYSHTLGDVVHKIYTKMDLLLFADEEDSSNQLLNSEDSSKSWREKPERKGMADDLSSSGRMSAEYEYPQLSEDNGESLPGNNQEGNDRRTTEARERRERARRFASFTSWTPDLRRVWAPKQKLMRPKSDSHHKLRKRKKQKASCDKVCETPMTGNKRPNVGRGNSDDIEYDSDHRGQSCGSVFKALFQDDE